MTAVFSLSLGFYGNKILQIMITNFEESQKELKEQSLKKAIELGYDVPQSCLIGISGCGVNENLDQCSNEDIEELLDCIE